MSYWDIGAYPRCPALNVLGNDKVLLFCYTLGVNIGSDEVQSMYLTDKERTK